MRINKFIAQAGLASRRGADELVKQGAVRVNGAVMKNPGYDVQDGDKVAVNGREISSQQKLCYYALNKPAGYVTTNSDEKDRPTALSLMTDVAERVFPVGRLDFNTSGLLIMTNDGELANRITHPRNHIKKTYVARVGTQVSREQLEALRGGVAIMIPKTEKDGSKSFERYKTRPAEVEIISESNRGTVLEISISEGKNRQIRRMAEAVGLNVLELERIAIGQVRLGRTKPGTYRKLTPAEIEYLKNC